MSNKSLRYNLLGEPVSEPVGRSLSWFSIIVLLTIGIIGVYYGVTAFLNQSGQNMRIDTLAYGLTNETNARVAKDMILMGNVSDLSININYIYGALNMTNNTGILIYDNLLYLNQSVINLTIAVNNIYNATSDVAYLNQTVASLIINVSALEAKTLLNGTGIVITDQSASSYGVINLSNISGVAGFHPFPSSVTVDEQGRITGITDGNASISSILVGPGISVDILNPTVDGGTINTTSPYLQLQVIGPPTTTHTYATVTYDQFGRITASANGLAPVTSVFAGSGMSFTTIDSLNPTGSISMPNVGTPGNYVFPSAISTDVQGRIISIVNGSASGTGTVTNVTAGVGLSGGSITTSGTISMPNVGTPGVHSSLTNITTDSQGRVTNIDSFTPARCRLTWSNLATLTDQPIPFEDLSLFGLNMLTPQVNFSAPSSSFVSFTNTNVCEVQYNGTYLINLIAFNGSPVNPLVIKVVVIQNGVVNSEYAEANPAIPISTGDTCRANGQYESCSVNFVRYFTQTTYISAYTVGAVTLQNVYNVAVGLYITRIS